MWKSITKYSGVADPRSTKMAYSKHFLQRYLQPIAVVAAVCIPVIGIGCRRGANTSVPHTGGGEWEAVKDLEEAGKLNEAARAYEALIKREPDFYPVQIDYAELLVKLRRYDDARKQYALLAKSHYGKARKYGNKGLADLSTAGHQLPQNSAIPASGK